MTNLRSHKSRGVTSPQETVTCQKRVANAQKTIVTTTLFYLDQGHTGCPLLFLAGNVQYKTHHMYNRYHGARRQFDSRFKTYPWCDLQGTTIIQRAVNNAIIPNIIFLPIFFVSFLFDSAFWGFDAASAGDRSIKAWWTPSTYVLAWTVLSRIDIYTWQAGDLGSQ